MLILEEEILESEEEFEEEEVKKPPKITRITHLETFINRTRAWLDFLNNKIDEKQLIAVIRVRTKAKKSKK